MFEITKIKDKRDSSVIIAEYKRKHGCKRLGYGAFSTVYSTKDKNRVLKVVTDYTGSDYPNYVKRLSKMKTHNPLLPQIFSAEIVQTLDEKLMIVEMERLERMEEFISEDQADSLAGILETMFTDAWTQHKSVKRKKQRKFIASCLSMVWHDPKSTEMFIEAAKVLGHPDDYDFHSENIMVRNRTQLVVIDPVA